MRFNEFQEAELTWQEMAHRQRFLERGKKRRLALDRVHLREVRAQPAGRVQIEGQHSSKDGEKVLGWTEVPIRAKLLVCRLNRGGSCKSGQLRFRQRPRPSPCTSSARAPRRRWVLFRPALAAVGALSVPAMAVALALGL